MGVLNAQSFYFCWVWERLLVGSLTPNLFFERLILILKSHDMPLWVEDTCHNTKARPLLYINYWLNFLDNLEKMLSVRHDGDC